MRHALALLAVALGAPALAPAGPIYTQDGQSRSFSNVGTDGTYRRYDVPPTLPAATKAPKAGTPLPGLHLAAFRDDVDEARKLLEQGADVDVLDSSSETPLMRAAWSGRAKMVGFLLDRGASTKARDQQGDTALHKAVSGRGNAEVLRLLLNAGADVRATNKYQQTPLHAVGLGNDEAARTLVAAGADPDATDQHGRIALPTSTNGKPDPAPYVAKAAPQGGRPWGERDGPPTVYHFDQHGSFTGVDAGGRSARIKYKYDPNGNVTRVETPRQIIDYTYNPVDLPTGVRVRSKPRR